MKSLKLSTAALLALAGSPAMAALNTNTLTFQQGVDNYMGTLDKRIGSGNFENGSNVAAADELGSVKAEYFVDGYGNNSPDEQALIRFDHIFGSAPGQIPQGAFILSASLQITTGSASANAKSPGPWGVAGLLQPFSETSLYTDFGEQGPSFSTGSATRAVGFFNVAGGEIASGSVQVAPITPLVNAWSTGAIANHGLAVQAGRVGTTDGWQIATSSHANVENRPKLAVTYTTDPVATVRFQQGVNGYEGTSMAWLQMNNTTTDGATLDAAFLDGFDGASSPADQALIKFQSIFASEGGSIPNDAEIVQAWLVVTSGSMHKDARTRGEYNVHQMLQNWDQDPSDSTCPTLFGEFSGGYGPDVSSGIVAPAASGVDGMISGGQAYFDVTSILQNWQAGQENFGFSLQAGMTSDGWQIHFTGADLSTRPELIVSYVLPAVPEPAALSLLLAPLGLLLRRRKAR